MISDQFVSFIVRVHDRQNRPVGAAFLASNQKLLTCAHVIQSALGQYGPMTSIAIDFPKSVSNTLFITSIDLWDQERDIAVLSMSDPIPHDVTPVSLVIEKELWGHPFRAFGFPAKYGHGVWVSGVLRGRTANSWLQVEDDNNTGYMIQPGFSGTPIFDDQVGGIVGMVTVADTDPRVRVAFAIPADVLVETIPDLTEDVRGPITNLGQLIDLAEVELRRKIEFFRHRLSFQKTPNDLLSVALILLMQKSFAESSRILEQFISREPLHAYASYTLALASLGGKRPRLLTYDAACAIHSQLLKALELDRSLTQAALLLALLTADYFESKGFQVTPNSHDCLRLVQGKRLERKEVIALLNLIPSDPSIPLVSAIRSIVS